jgi:hypothetical protein
MAKGSPLTVAGAAPESGLCSKEPTLTVFPFDPQREPSPERLDEIATQVNSFEAAPAINPKRDPDRPIFINETGARRIADRLYRGCECLECAHLDRWELSIKE